MLDAGLPDARAFPSNLADLLYPQVLAQHSQRLRQRFVQRFSGHLDGVLGARRP